MRCTKYNHDATWLARNGSQWPERDILDSGNAFDAVDSQRLNPYSLTLPLYLRTFVSLNNIISPSPLADLCNQAIEVKVFLFVIERFDKLLV